MGEHMAERGPLQRGLAESPITYGACTACGAVEVALDRVTGTRDYSDIGESPTYPTGHGCEVCG